MIKSPCKECEDVYKDKNICSINCIKLNAIQTIEAHKKELTPTTNSDEENTICLKN